MYALACILFLKIYDFDRAVSGLRQKVSHGLLGILGNSWEGPGIVGKDFNYGRQAALVLARVARPLSHGLLGNSWEGPGIVVMF
jgi:hypothetical protein